MHKTLRVNAPLPYPHLVTLILQHVNVPVANEHFVKVKHSFAIGATGIAYRKDIDGQWVRKQDINAPDKCTPSPPPPSFFFPEISTPKGFTIVPLLP